MSDNEIAAMIFPPALIDEIHGFRGDLKRIGTTPEKLMGCCLASCSHMAKLGLQLLKRVLPHVEWLEGCFPIHAAIIGRLGEHIFIYDSALGKISDVYRFDDIYEQAGTGRTYVLKDYAAACRADDEAVTRGEEPAAVRQFMNSHPLADYYFYQPVNKNGYASVFTLNVGDVYRVFYRASREDTYLIKALTHFLHARRLHPDLAESHSAISRIYRELYRLTKRPIRIHMAIDESHQAVKLNPYDPGAYFHLGLAYLEKAQQLNDRAILQDAIRSFYKAGRLHPDYMSRITRLLDQREEHGEIDLTPPFQWSAQAMWQRVQSRAPEPIMSRAN